MKGKLRSYNTMQPIKPLMIQYIVIFKHVIK